MQQTWVHSKVEQNDRCLDMLKPIFERNSELL